MYLDLLRALVNERGKTAIVLVPEIALTPQTVSRFRAVFGDKVAVLHSALSDGERYDAWLALERGEKRIAVGARSAVFAPLRNLGAIVVDEEHETSYKQGEAPRYHAREVAIVRARDAGRGRRAGERDAESRELGQRALGQVSSRSRSRSASAAAVCRRSMSWTCAPRATAQNARPCPRTRPSRGAC